MKTKLNDRKISNSGKKLIVSLEVDKDVLMFYGSADMGILYSNIRFWCLHNEDKNEETHFHDGVWWTYNTGADFAKEFPFWSIKKIYKMLNTLEKDGFIKKSNFNKNKFDRTCWYSIVSDDDLPFPQTKQFHFPDRGNGITGSDLTIPYNKLQIDKQQIDTYSMEQSSARPKNKKTYNQKSRIKLNNTKIHNDKKTSCGKEKNKIQNSELKQKQKCTDLIDFPGHNKPLPPTPSPATTSFTWCEYLDKMMNDNKEHIVMIAKYFKLKNISFDTKEAASAAIRKNVRIATILTKSFTRDDLNLAVKFCRDVYDKKNLTWTLDTLLKVLSTYSKDTLMQKQTSKLNVYHENIDVDNFAQSTKIY